MRKKNLNLRNTDIDTDREPLNFLTEAKTPIKYSTQVAFYSRKVFIYMDFEYPFSKKNQVTQVDNSSVLDEIL